MFAEEPVVLTDAEEAFLTAALKVGSGRTERLVLPTGRVLWIKRSERLGLLRRLQKGDPAAAFAAEVAAIRGLHEMGHPVPQIVASGPDHMVLTDGGANLQQLLFSGDLSDTEAKLAFATIGRALAALHCDGFAHGRPVLRDFCWAAGRLTMIDLERCALRPRRARTRAQDLVIFAQGWFGRRGVENDDARLLDVTMAAYRDAGAPEAVWTELAVLARWLGWLEWVPRLGLWLRPRWREMQAAVWTIGYLRGLVARG